MDPIGGISLALGGAQAILGALGGAAENAAAKQEHMNQVAFQNANTAYARWQAGFNQRVNGVNAEYNYWQQTVNYNQSLAYSRSMANYEMLREIASGRCGGPHQGRCRGGLCAAQRGDQPGRGRDVDA
jgi:hypothetical protein